MIIKLFNNIKNKLIKTKIVKEYVYINELKSSNYLTNNTLNKLSYILQELALKELNQLTTCHNIELYMIEKEKYFKQNDNNLEKYRILASQEFMELQKIANKASANDVYPRIIANLAQICILPINMSGENTFKSSMFYYKLTKKELLYTKK